MHNHPHLPDLPSASTDKRYPNHCNCNTMDQSSSAVEEKLRQNLTLLEVASIDPEESECAICLDPFLDAAQKLQEHPAELQCGHIFGQKCITEWLNKKNTCPKCRAQVLSFPAGQDPRLQLEYRPIAEYSHYLVQMVREVSMSPFTWPSTNETEAMRSFHETVQSNQRLALERSERETPQRQ